MEHSPVSDTPYLCREVDHAMETGYESLVITDDDGALSLSVLVGNVTCALCIQKIESALARQQGVSVARLNFGAKRLLITWHGTPAQANDFVRCVEELGYTVQPYDTRTLDSAVHAEGRSLLLCLGVAGFAMGNIMLLSVGVWSAGAGTGTMGDATRGLFHWLSAFIALPTIMFSGRPFFRSALSVLLHGHTNMDVPISIGVLLATGMSLYEVLHHGQHIYFESAVMLIFFLLIGRYLDFRAREHARSSAHDLLQSFHGFATVMDDGQARRVYIRDITENMILRIHMGETFPVDGLVLEGSSSVDTSLVTGETVPRDVGAGDAVFAGTLNVSAPVTLRVTGVAENTLLGDIVRLMDRAGQAQAAYVRIADRAARLYTPVVHTLAALAFVGWLAIGGLVWQESMMIAITVLIITCPCALGLAVPVVQVLATGQLMRQAIFVKSGDALERLAEVDTVMFDKTGTLTTGVLELVGEYDKASLEIAASIAAYSQHPLSQAIAAAYDGRLATLDTVQEHAGQGLQGEYKGEVVRLGSRVWCGDDASPSDGTQTELWLRVGRRPPLCFKFEDCLRDDAAEIIQKLHARGLKTLLVSGDREPVARRIARACGIQTVHAEMLPNQKFEIMQDLQQQGCHVMMVGDGLNDAPVLAQANVSMAPGTAVDMAQNAADIVFMGAHLAPVYEAFKTARVTQKLVKQNFALAILYNMFAIPLAVAGYVTPLIAALAMSGSSVLVIVNSFRLKLKL